MTKQKLLIGGVVALAAVIALVPAAKIYAEETADSRLTQEILGGVLSTDIRDADGEIVDSPSFAMSDVSVSGQQQTSTGVFGDDDNRIYSDNPGAADDGWTLAWGATTPVDGWKREDNSYRYNGTPVQGQLTIDPSAATLNGSAAGVTLGQQASFTGTTPLTLVTSDATSDTVWTGYLTGVGLSQTIPAGTPAGSYTLDMTQTITAN